VTAGLALVLAAAALAAQADDRSFDLLAPPSREAHAPTLVVTVPAVTGRVGDALEMTLSVEGAPEGSQFEFPDPTLPFGDLDVVSWTGEKATRTYRLRSFVPGDHLVPKLRVTVHPAYGDGETESLVLETADEQQILSFEGLVPDDAKDIRPEKGGLPVSAPIRWERAVALVAILLLVSLFLNRKRRAKKRSAGPPPPPPVPADIAALRAIGELERSGLAARGEVKEHFYVLSSILRTYVEARFGIAAPDMTSEEFLEATAASSVLPERHRGSLQDFMRIADLAKYARFRPATHEIGSTLESARRFVLETPSIPAPAPSSAPANDGADERAMASAR
jgi:hypothetical protein